MSIAELAANGPARIQIEDPRVLILDIERMKGQASVEFWDLGDYKNRRIHADDVTSWPRNICAAWKWYGDKRLHFAAEWEDGGPDAMHQRIWDAYDRAAIVVGHNLQGFDTKKLKTAWRDMGLPAPSPFKTVDTLTVARREFGDESKTLDALCKRLGLVAKTDKYDVETARAACAGNKAAQRKLQGYNQGDILATEALYDALRPWMSSHPHMGVLSEDEMRCNACGSTDIQRNGEYLAVQIKYVAYRCGNCGNNLRGVSHSRAANLRGVR